MKATHYFNFRLASSHSERMPMNSRHFQISTHKLDRDGMEIFQGDFIKLNNHSKFTKKEYWNPIFEVVHDGFEFSLKHSGGGKSPDNIMFTLRYYPHKFEIIKS